MSGFKPFKTGMDALAKGDGTQKVLLEASREVERLAKADAAGYQDTGAYLRGFRTKVRRGGVTLGNTDFAAHIQEWGSAKAAPRAILRRAVRAAGLRLKEDQR